jgi:N-acetylneuraminic acid mutarotase
VGCGEDGGNSTQDSAVGDTCSRGTGWSSAPAVLGGPIQETAVVAVDGKIYVIGGFDASLEIVRSVRVFDTGTCLWSDGPQLPKPMHHANAAVVNGTIYIVGAMEVNFTAIGDVWAWNPNTDAGWAQRTSMPQATQRGAAVAGAIGDRIYVAGGLRNGAVTTLSSYSTTTDSWDSNLPPLPEARDHGCGGVLDGKLYVVGGRNTGITSVSNLVFEYSPGGDWVMKASMPTARGGTACGLSEGRIVVIGGEGNGSAPSGVFPQAEIYTLASDRWDSLPDMPTPRHGMGGAAWDGVMYVPGGATKQGFGAVDDHEALVL